MPFPAKKNMHKEFLINFKTGEGSKAFNSLLNGIAFQEFLRRCKLLVHYTMPHKISWHLRLKGSNYKTIGVNRTLFGGTTPILKHTWNYECLWFELDWLNEKLTTSVRDIVLQESEIKLDF